MATFKHNSTGNLGETMMVLAPFAFFATMFAAWITHVIVTIGAGAWGLLIAGAILFPVGIIHGIGAWFGAW